MITDAPLHARSPSAVSWTGTAASAMSPASATYSSYSVVQPAGSSSGAGAAAQLQQSVTGTATQGATMQGAGMQGTGMQGTGMQGQQPQMPQAAAAGRVDHAPHGHPGKRRPS